jgi:hypothetical protein
MKITTLLTTFLFAMCSSSVFAEERLSKAEVIELFSGKTVHYEVVKKDLKVVAYFDPSGEAREMRGNKPDNHPWWVEDDGKHCIRFAGKQKANCKYVTKRSDGTYVKYNKKGKLQVQYNRFEDGNTSDL